MRLSCPLLVCLALPLTAAAPACGQSCRPYWADIGVGFPSYPLSIAAFRDGTGSYLFGACECNSGHVYRWDGQSWADVSATLPVSPFRFVGVVVLDDGNGPVLYAMGNLQPPPITYFARRWSGAAWIDAPAGFVPLDGNAGPSASIDLGAGARIYGLIRNPANGRFRFARWDDPQWTAISPEFAAINNYRYVAFNDGTGPHLYAIGQFVSIGGVTVNGFARWSGTAWEAAPGNQTSVGQISDVAMYDDGNGPAIFAYGYIYVGSTTQELPGVARWDGQTWVGLGGPSGGPGQAYARTRIEVFDDGSGPALYVTGQFLDWGGVEAHGIAKWDGHAWSAVDWGIAAGGEVKGMVVGEGPAGPTMFIGGILDRAGAGTVYNIVERVGCPNCYANCDTSTVGPRLNVRDFMCFLNKFAANDPYADCNSSITIDIADFACFMNRFVGGCP